MAEILHYELDMDQRSQWKIVTVHPATKANLIYVQEVGDFYSGRNYYTVREGLDSFLIKLTLSGAGVLEYGGKEYRLTAGQFFWIDCQNPQRYYTDPQIGHWHVIWVHFRGANARAYYEMFQSIGEGSPIGTLPVHYDGESMLKDLMARYDRDDSAVDNDIAASALLTQLLAYCIQAMSPQEDSRSVPDVVQKIRSYLLEHYADNMSLEMLSREFSVSKYHLQRVFKKYVGQSPLEFLSGVRMTRAKELLRTTDMPVSEIAYRIGMESTSYFVSKFRSQEDITPHKYRKFWSNG